MKNLVKIFNLAVLCSASALSATCGGGGYNQAGYNQQNQGGMMQPTQNDMMQQDQGGMMQPTQGNLRERVQTRIQQTGANPGEVKERVQQSSWFNRGDQENTSNDRMSNNKDPEENNNGNQRTSWFKESSDTNEPASNDENKGFFSSMTGKDSQSQARDQQLIARARQALQSNNLNVRAIQITSDDGTLTLKGVVFSPADKESAEAAVKNVQGVKSVSNKLSVQQQDQ